ncbi:MAG: isoprenylcysteine carboxylmethyltransferase family protein [Rhizomicrobium sp.]
MSIRVLFYAIWVAWAVSWFVAAAWTSRTQKRPAFSVTYRIFTLVGAILLLDIVPLPRVTLWLAPNGVVLALAAVTAAGFAFSWWARIHLGRLWSGAITRKENHRVVDTGPYRIVRHPIYTGIIVASYATAAAQGTLAVFAGATLMALGWYIKARLEERFLRTELGAEAYDAYARKTAMLVPFARF